MSVRPATRNDDLLLVVMYVVIHMTYFSHFPFFHSISFTQFVSTYFLNFYNTVVDNQSPIISVIIDLLLLPELMRNSWAKLVAKFQYDSLSRS